MAVLNHAEALAATPLRLCLSLIRAIAPAFTGAMAEQSGRLFSQKVADFS
jgi:hypothetical protein